MEKQEQEKEKENKKEGEFEKLQAFSEELLDLGREIEEKFISKQALEEEIAVKEKEARTLQIEVFRLKEKLIKLNLELLKLEERRRELEGGE